MKYQGLKLGLFTLALGLSGWANAACYIGPETNASTVQEDSGNGTYACGLVSTANGTLTDVTSQVNWSVGLDGRVTWSVPVDANDNPTVDVDLVSVRRSSGKRCNYVYSEQKAGGEQLSTSDLGTATGVTFCADNFINAMPPKTPEPFSTAKDGCYAEFTEAGNGQFDVAIGYSKQQDGGLYEGVAICAGDGQKQCINECVPKPYVTDSTICSPDPVTGRVSLECAQCESEPSEATKQLLNDPDIKYCFYYQNQVDETTFKPSPLKKNVSIEIGVTTGSNCYTVTSGPLYGGKTYSYWYCPK
jgi:hypothetical protein